MEFIKVNMRPFLLDDYDECEKKKDRGAAHSKQILSIILGTGTHTRCTTRYSMSAFFFHFYQSVCLYLIVFAIAIWIEYVAFGKESTLQLNILRLWLVCGWFLFLYTSALHWPYFVKSTVNVVILLVYWTVFIASNRKERKKKNNIHTFQHTIEQFNRKRDAIVDTGFSLCFCIQNEYERRSTCLTSMFFADVIYLENPSI